MVSHDLPAQILVSPINRDRARNMAIRDTSTWPSNYWSSKFCGTLGSPEDPGSPRKKRTKRTDIPIIASDTCGLPEKFLNKQQEMWPPSQRWGLGLNEHTEMTMKSEERWMVNIIQQIIYIYIILHNDIDY